MKWILLLVLLLSAEAHATLSSAYTAWTNSFPSAPFVAGVGHSILMGYNNYASALNNNPSPASGDTNGDFTTRLLVNTGYLLGTNFGVSGALASFCQNVAINNAISKHPKYLVYMSAVNSLQNGDTWASAIGATYEAVRVECVKSNCTMIVSEEWPGTLVTESVANSFNNSVRTWVSTNAGGSVYIPAHSWMADTASTNTILAAWTFDNVHPTLAGTERWTQLILGKLRYLEGETNTYAAEDASYIGTAFAIEAAQSGTSSNGDTVAIPAGNVGWSAKLLVNKGITVQGNGIGSTIITNNLTGDYLINGALVADKNTRITGIEIRGGPSTLNFNTMYFTGENTDNRRLRIDHCKFKDLVTGGTLKLDTVLGVFDHNELYGNAPGNQLAHIKDSTWNGKLHGAGAWTNATPLFGSENFFFFEDNILSSTNTIFIMSLIDAQAGGRYVFRFNTVTNAYIEGHGSEASYERSVHAVEVYGNVFQQQNVNQIVSFFRGGTGLIFSNAVSGVNGTAGCLKLEHNRMNDSEFDPFGGADGRNHWDVNHASSPFATGTATSGSGQTVTVSGTPWTSSQWIGYTIRRTNGKSVTSITRSGTTLTVTSTGHGFSNGDHVSIYGANQQEYNTLFTITVTGTDTFTCSTVGSLPTSPATGTIFCHLGNYFAEITANTSSQITFNASVFGGDRNMVYAANDTFEINKVTHGMDQVGRTGGSLIDDTATPAFPGAWNDQTTSPWYQWQNGLGGQATVNFSPTSGSIVNGVHYTNNVALAGFTPYTYPHPLVSPAAPDSGVAAKVQFGGKTSFGGKVN